MWRRHDAKGGWQRSSFCEFDFGSLPSTTSTFWWTTAVAMVGSYWSQIKNLIYSICLPIGKMN
jgi:hypothetical protein